MKVLWFVNSGPDRSHMHNCEVFTRLMDAKQHAQSLPKTPHGTERPYAIERAEYVQSKIHGDIVERKIIHKNH